MIPVTVFAGRKVAVFGLGGSGLVHGEGARRRRRARLRLRRQCRFRRQCRRVRCLDDRGPARLPISPPSPRWCWRPGVPLTHPEPHWSVAKARAAGIEIIGDIELFCRERRALCAGCALRRHHRHQRQVDDHGADRPSLPLGRPRRAARRQYRHGDPVAGAAAPTPASTSSNARRSRSTSRRASIPAVGILLNVTEDHLDRHGTHGALCRDQGAAGRRRDDGRCRHRRRLERARSPTGIDRGAAGSSSGSRSGKRLADGYLCRGAESIYEADDADVRDGRQPRRHRLAARRPQCAERGGGLRGGLCARPLRGRGPGGLASFPGACPSHGRGRRSIGRGAVRQRFRRRPTPTRADKALASFDAHLLDPRRQGEDRRHRQPRTLFRPDRQGLL